MKSFFKRQSKKNAKSRLLNCIENDRANVSGAYFDKMFSEIESVLKKYFDINDGLKFCVEKQKRENVYTLTLNNLRYKVR